MELTTLTGDKSLILAQQTLNRSNILGLGDLFFKDNYFNVFDQIARDFESATASFNTFTDKWQEVIAIEEALIKQQLIKYLTTALSKSEITDEDKSHINLILNKFRGNCGEIFAEAFFRKGFMSSLGIESIYDPVDPTNERYDDGRSYSMADGLPIGIQVKTFSKHTSSAINSQEIFNKTTAMYVRTLLSLSDSDKLKFMTQPRQIIFSFTDFAEDYIQEDYKETTLFIGPKFINKANLQGNFKKGLKPNYKFFKDIADTIENSVADV